MKDKSEVGKYLTTFCNMVKTQFDKQVKRVRTDNGAEFQSHYMLNFYKDSGIMLETSCPYTPQQNGVVERKHRHILEIARALRFEANLPLDFWGECVLTATYIINKLPSKVINFKTPHEILLGKPPSYDHFRIFGCLVYAHDNQRKGDKFSERGRPCIFIGYPMGQKGYKVYDLQNQNIYTTRDVTFLEEIFPFANGFRGLTLNGEMDLAQAVGNAQKSIGKNTIQEQLIRETQEVVPLTESTDVELESHATHK